MTILIPGCCTRSGSCDIFFSKIKLLHFQIGACFETFRVLLFWVRPSFWAPDSSWVQGLLLWWASFLPFLGGVLGTVGTFPGLTILWVQRGDTWVPTSVLSDSFFYFFTVIVYHLAHFYLPFYILSLSLIICHFLVHLSLVISLLYCLRACAAAWLAGLSLHSVSQFILHTTMTGRPVTGTYL